MRRKCLSRERRESDSVKVDVESILGGIISVAEIKEETEKLRN